MAKTERGVRARKGDEGLEVEHRETFDDNSIPPSEEIAKLSAIDPNLVPWLMSYLDKEQEERWNTAKSFHEIEKKKIELTESNQKRLYRLDVGSLTIAAIVLICGMAASVAFIYLGQTVTGTIFTGMTLVLAVNSFLNFNKSKKK